MVHGRALLHPDSTSGGPPRSAAAPPPVTLQPDEDEPMPVPVTPPPTRGPAAQLNRPAVAPAAPAPPPRELPPDEAAPKIRAMDQRLAGGGARHEENWKRSPNVTGTGAIHCKSFHCKLTGDSLENLDRQINEWLDAHPQYEVKFVTATVGEWLGKLKEPNLILQVWV